GGLAAVSPPAAGSPTTAGPDQPKPAETIPLIKGLDITNLLPNDIRAVVSIQMDKVLASSLNRAALLTRGAFNPDDFERAYGFTIDNVQGILVGLTENNNGVFTVVRTAKPYDRKLLRERLDLAPEPPVNALEFFTVRNGLDAFSNLVIKGHRTRDKVQLRL